MKNILTYVHCLIIYAEAETVMSPTNRDSLASAEHGESSTTAEAWQEESSRQARRLTSTAMQGPSLFAEFRRKLACGETLSRALERLAEALRFSGRLTVTFHQGKITKTVLEESYYRGKADM